MDDAVQDTEWLAPERLYLARGDECPEHRPLYQGDVVDNVPLPTLPKSPPSAGNREIEFTLQACMLLPHPCACYNGDTLRKQLTVAPVVGVMNYDNFGTARDRALDKFALPSLWKNSGGEGDCVANLGRLMTIPSQWLKSGRRISCLSHEGLGLLAKRVIRFQLRNRTSLVNGMAYTRSEWAESYLMEAWTVKHGTLVGYSEWLKTPIALAGVADGEPIAPYAVRAGATDSLLEKIRDS